MPFDLADFTLIDMLQCGRGIRHSTAGCETLEEAAHAIVQYLYAELHSANAVSQKPALVRFYKTQPYRALDARLQRFAASHAGGMPLTPETRCLTLLGTAGQRPEWCDATRSEDHQAIPLPSVNIVEQAPMIAQLIRGMGMDIRDVIAPDPLAIPERERRTYDVFHVENALGSPFIPVQEQFVVKYGIRSVVGFGGMLADGELFAVIIFSRGHIPPESAARFRNIALDVKATIHPLVLPPLGR